jgi:nucleotide-binding universal stress UspA family protein
MSMKIAKILAPTDLSNLSLSGVRCAMDMAVEQDAEVLVYHVIGEDGDWFTKDDELNPARALVPRQQQRLEEFIKENCGEFIGRVKIQQIVEVGVPYKAIVQRAGEEKADLIVISTHGRTGLEQVMVGSVTAQVVARSACPVLTIRPAK